MKKVLYIILIIFYSFVVFQIVEARLQFMEYGPVLRSKGFLNFSPVKDILVVTFIGTIIIVLVYFVIRIFLKRRKNSNFKKNR